MLGGFMFGFILAGLLGVWSQHEYRKILVMKAAENCKTPEHINGNFYYIISESEYVDLKLNAKQK